jgi:hypothetical protein
MKKIYNIIVNSEPSIQELRGSISADGTTTLTTKAVIRDKLRYSKWSCLNRRSSLRTRADKGQLELVIKGSCEKEPKSYYYCPGKLLCRTS